MSLRFTTGSHFRCSYKISLASIRRWKHQSRSFTFQTQQIKLDKKYREYRRIFEYCILRNDLTEADWYQKSPQNLLDEEASKILKRKFKGSLYSALSTLFPETDWLPWKFNNQQTSVVPLGYFREPSNQRKFFDDLGKQLGIKTLDDWYDKLSTKLVKENGGNVILSSHNFSAIEALTSAYPEHNWLIWKFNVVPQGYWKSTQVQRQFFDWLGLQLGVKQLDDWYQKISQDILQQYGAAGVLRAHNWSFFEALKTAYPEHNWIPWKFNVAPQGFWSSQKNQRQFFDWLGQELGVKELDDWYQKISIKAMLQNRGGTILSLHSGSAIEALKYAYPEHNWITWKFGKVPKGYWQSVDNQRKYLDDLGKELGVKSPEDWFEKLPKEAIYEAHLLEHGSLLQAFQKIYPEHNWDQWDEKRKSSLKKQRKERSNQQREQSLAELKTILEKLNLTENEWYQFSLSMLEPEAAKIIKTEFKGSLYKALSTFFPQTEWLAWKFKYNQVPEGFWKDLSNQRKFFDDLASHIGIKTLDDWYDKLSFRLIQEHGGWGLLDLYNRSAVRTIQGVYPEHNWVTWKFRVVPLGFWNSDENIRSFVQDLSEKLSIQTMDDWYRVDFAQLQQLGAQSLLSKFKSVHGLVKHVYPHYEWNPVRFKTVGKKTQRWLAVNLKKIFPGEEILEDYIHPKASFPSSRRPMQLDVFIPSRSLAFEYQGKQHFQEVGVFSPLRMYQERDEEKRALCAANNIKLIEVPYWWNRTQEGLQQMIHEAAPELLL